MVLPHKDGVPSLSPFANNASQADPGPRLEALMASGNASQADPGPLGGPDGFGLVQSYTVGSRDRSLFVYLV